MLTSILLFALYFFLITYGGLLLLRRLVPSENSLFITLPLATTVGLAIYLALLNLAIHFVSFTLANRILLPVFCLVAFLSCPKSGRFLIPTLKLGLTKFERKALVVSIVVLLVAFTALLSGTFNYDHAWHSTISLSIINGNIPLRWPWYPDYFLGYHYGVDLLKASTQDFCDISQFYSDKPWHIVFIIGTFLFVFGFVQRHAGGKVALPFYAAGCFLFFEMLPFDLLVNVASQLVTKIQHGDHKGIYDLLSGFYGEDPAASPYWMASLHKPSMLKYPLFLAIAYLTTVRQSSNSQLFWHIPVVSLLLGFLALSEITMFVVLTGAIIVFFGWQAFKMDRKQMLTSLLSAGCVIFMAVLLALYQGGVLTAKLFYGHLQFPEGSQMARTGGFSDIHIEFNILRAMLDVEHIRNGLPFIGILVLSSVYFMLNRKAFSRELTGWAALLLITFFVGMSLGLLIQLPVKPTETMRFFLWPLGYVVLGLSLGNLLENHMRPPVWQTKLAHVLLITAITFVSILQILAGSVVSAGYQFSNTKRQVARAEAFGKWLRENLDSDVRLFGFDPRYTGLYSYGGNSWRDFMMMEDYEEYEKAKESIQYEFLRKHRISHLIVDSGKSYENADILFDVNKFEEMSTPYQAGWRVYALR